MTNTTPIFVHDNITDVLDRCAALDDPLDRLAALHYAARMGFDRINTDREKAAFEVRTLMSLESAHEATGIARERLATWSSTYRKRTGDRRPYLVDNHPPARQPQDWSHAVILDPPLLE